MVTVTVQDALLSHCRSVRTLALVGTAKNVGKTTTLNWLLSRLDGPVAITSVGRDGEDVDLLTGRPKPRVHVVAGTLVITAEKAFRRSRAELSLLATTPFKTALGRLGIYRAESAGTVELAGPVITGDLTELIDLAVQYGARQVLVDGAIDRRASAAAGLCEGVLLATGLALDPDPKQVGIQTRQWVDLFTLPAPPDDWAIPQPLQSGWLDDTWHAWEPCSVLEQGARLAQMLGGNTRAVTVNGALTNRILLDLLDAGIGCPIVVRDGTCILVEPATYRRFLDGGGRFYAATPLKLVGITVNPTTPEAAVTVDPTLFLGDLHLALGTTVPVVDLLLADSRLQ